MSLIRLWNLLCRRWSRWIQQRDGHIVLTAEDFRRVPYGTAHRWPKAEDGCTCGGLIRLTPPEIAGSQQGTNSDDGVIRITPPDTEAFVIRLDPPEIERILSKIPPEEAIIIRVDEVLEYTDDNFHGTREGIPAKIEQEGWVVGNGTGVAAGVYFSVGRDSIALSYARPCLIRARVDWGNVAYLDDREVQRKYNDWCRRKRRTPCGDALTEWGREERYHSVMQSRTGRPTIGVMLHPRTSGRQRFMTPRIQIAEVRCLANQNSGVGGAGRNCQTPARACVLNVPLEPQPRRRFH